MGLDLDLDLEFNSIHFGIMFKILNIQKCLTGNHRFFNILLFREGFYFTDANFFQLNSL